MAIGNDFAKGFQYLEQLFGESNFRVRNMTDEMVSQLANQIGYPNDRSSIARWLTSMDCNVYTTEDGRVVELNVVESADDSKPGIYQMRIASQKTHSRHDGKDSGPSRCFCGIAIEDASRLCTERDCFYR